MSRIAFNKLPNILPCNGDARYMNDLFGEPEAELLFAALLRTISWRHDEVNIFGKHYVTSRKTAWYAINNIDYSYSGIKRQSLPFTKELHYLNNFINALTGDHFNACLLNLYNNGEEGMGWHSDDEKTIVENSTIASISFGAPRRFAFRHKHTAEKVPLLLENGSLLLMRNETQIYWQHALLKSKKILSPRINLTFRLMK